MLLDLYTNIVYKKLNIAKKCDKLYNIVTSLSLKLQELKMLEEIITAAAENEEPVNDISAVDEHIIYISASGTDFNRLRLDSCRFENCDFMGASFINCTLTRCTFIDCTFSGSYFRECTLSECSANGCSFTKSLFRKTEIRGGFYRYANFSDSVFEGSEITDAALAESAFIQVKLKKTALRSVDLSKCDVLGTPLKGIDLSECDISGLLLSENLRELRGARINTLQAAELVRLLDIEVSI